MPQPAPEITLTIVFNPLTKECRVTGPIADFLLCRLGLELADRALKQYQRKQIVLPSGAPASSLVKPGGA